MSNWITGVDIGGTHITACMVDTATGQMMEGSCVRGEIDPLQNREHIIAAWAKTIAACARQHGSPVNRVGIALPGPFNYEQGISYITGLHKYESLYGLNVKALLAAELGIPSGNIRMTNDATAYLSGELKAGAGKGCDHIAGITLGTGLGSAMYEHGVFREGDLWCFPFRESRAEEFLSSRWFVSAYLDRRKQQVTGVKELAAIAHNDTIAMQLFKEFGYTLGEVLKERFHGHFPERIVIGGNIAKAWDLFKPYCEEVLRQHAPGCALTPARLGENAALIGAAYLWEQNKMRRRAGEHK
ncbi:MAG TPA: ROK family protein [Agriterribacter sp.]|nr:ROK family protein [Agriterribacter sp.]